MKKFSLAAIARAEQGLAGTASNGRSSRTVHGGHEKKLRQTVIALKAGTELQEHDNPDEATILVLSGRIKLTSGEQIWEGRSEDFLILPQGRVQLSAIEESNVLFTVAKP